MEAHIPFHGREARSSDHEQSKQDHNPTTDDVELVAPAQQRLTERRGGGAE